MELNKFKMTTFSMEGVEIRYRYFLNNFSEKKLVKFILNIF